MWFFAPASTVTSPTTILLPGCPLTDTLIWSLCSFRPMSDKRDSEEVWSGKGKPG